MLTFIHNNAERDLMYNQNSKQRHLKILTTSIQYSTYTYLYTQYSKAFLQGILKWKDTLWSGDIISELCAILLC